MKGPRFIRPYQLAKTLGVKRQSVYRWIRGGKVPADKVKIEKVIVKRLVIAADFRLK